MENYKLKIVIFSLLVIVLSIILFYGIFGFSVSYLSEEEIKEDRKKEDELINYFKINNIDTVYDKVSNIYYYTVPENYEGQKYTLKLELDNGYKYKILNHATNIITVDYQKEYNVIIFNDKYYYETKIVLTNLPLVNITTDIEITDNDTNAVFEYINPENLDQIVNYNSKIKIRGATTKRYNKKSYKVEFYDKDFDKEKNINISNFYYGSTYILDAMFRDNSKIRNVFSNDLWNDIAKDFTNVDIYSEYVELFINGEYIGLYAFTEPVNRKNLNLNKSSATDTSVIIKANSEKIPDKNDNFKNILEDLYLDYEMKYPNDEELFSISWEKILNKLIAYYDEDVENTEENLSDILDINNYVDVLIYNAFIDNTDNDMKKNNYFYLKNLSSKLYIQPWEMEFTFGLSFNEDAPYDFQKDMSKYDNIDFRINDEDIVKIKKLIINRYWNLRRNILSEANLVRLLSEYKSDLTKGAAKRDTNKWLEYEVEEEINDIEIWLKKRIKVFDNYIRSLENE